MIKTKNHENSVSCERPYEIVTAAGPWKIVGEIKRFTHRETETFLVFERTIIEVKNFLDDFEPEWEEISRRIEKKTE